LTVHGSGSECSPSTQAKKTTNVSELKTMLVPQPCVVAVGR
jgi:hypothetical protein